MNHITIEFCKEDRQRLDELISIASLLVTTVQGKRITPEEFAAGAVEPQHPADTPATHLEVVQPEPEAAPAPIIISLPEFQKAITLVCAKGAEQKKAARQIITSYAPSVSEIPEDKRAAVIAELEKI